MKWLECLVAIVYLVECTMECTLATSEGTYFAVGFSPTYYTAYRAELILNAKQTTSVNITTSTTSEVVTVSENLALHYEVAYAMRTIRDIEVKAMYVTSEDPITVYVATYSSSDYNNVIAPDSVLVRPITESSMEYFLAGYDDMDVTGRPTSFYMVVATENNTDVDVFYTDNGVTIEDEHITLQKYEVFTRDCYLVTGSPAVDFTGTRVLATKPVAVTAGIGRAKANTMGGSTYVQYLSDSMPTVSELGMEYTTFPIHFGGDGGYEVRVIAVADDTDVTVPAFSISLTLNTGEFHVIDNNITLLSLRVSCSKPCMVAQYVRTLPPDDDGDMMGGFLAVLTPEESATRDLIFAVPRFIDYKSYHKGAISILTNTYPVSGLYLNDISLSDLNWQPVDSSSNWFSSVEIDAGFYQLLYSNESSERFTAYMYVVNTANGAIAFGHALGYEESTLPTTPPPTTTPPGGEPPSSPLFRMVLLGNFTSLDGDEFTPYCTEALGNNWQAKAAAMIPGLNSMIGQDMCTYMDVVTGDIRIVSLSSQLKATGTAGKVDVSYLLEAANHVTISNLTSCADELSVYLQVFDNWGRPIVPLVQDCAEPFFDPDYLFDGPTGDEWVCRSSNSVDEPSLAEVDAPLYSLSVYDNFTTQNDENLDEPCSYAYQLAWQQEAAQMATTLNGGISAGNLCTGGADKFDVISSTTTFFSQDTHGSMTATFFMKLAYDHLRFDDVYDCTSEMFLFLYAHTNWGTLPILPQQPGCPELNFNPAVFYHNGEAWRCV